MVDAKIAASSPSLIKPTGTVLLVLLTVIIYGLVLGVSPSLVPTLLIPLTISAVISAGLGYLVIPALRRLKTVQVIQEDGPQTHLKKAGTPTMGGIFFVPTALIVSLVASKFNLEVVAVSLTTGGYFTIGWVDDWQILRQQSNKGISPKMKLVLQIVVAVVYLLWLFQSQSDHLEEFTQVVLFSSFILTLGLLFWPLAVFAMTAESNATNLTDGVDGLAGGTAAIALTGLGLLIVPTHLELAIFCVSLAGSCLGFILHNRNPAKVFMGDTGSLALGGALAAVAILTGKLWGLFLISGIFFIESVSVIAQVSYYKATKGTDGKGKRLFKMAPLHHHLELSGWAETQVVGVFYLVNTVLVILAIVTK